MSVSIATWNLDRAKQMWRRDELRARMETIGAEIWVLTETRDSVSPGSGYRRVATSAEGARGKNDERWVTIWTILPDRGSRSTRDDEYATSALITLPSGMVLAVYGTVLPWRGSVWRGTKSAGAAAYKAAIAVQANDWSELCDATDVDGVCVAGDFNQDLSDKPYYWSTAAKSLLLQSLRECGLICATSGSNDPVRKLTGQTRACIDHICLSQRVASQQHGKPEAWAPIHQGRKLSDHPGVRLELADV